MRPATGPRDSALDERLLLVDPHGGEVGDAHVRDLPRFLRAEDLLVVNDAATLPASLRGLGPSGRSIEVRLVERRPDGLWSAVLMGEGDWRARTEDRPAPEPLAPRAVIRFGEGVRAVVVAVASLSPRLVTLRFDRDGAALWNALYRLGRPVQYSYLRRNLELWDVQTPYASRPWAAESPSAGRPLRWSLLLALRRSGVGIATITHAAGLSSTGDEKLDELLPLPERFEIAERTVAAIGRAKASGGRIVAVGTTVVRALEGAALANGGVLRAGTGVTDLKIDAAFRPRVVDGLLTGIHEPETSHFKLLTAFAPPDLLSAAHRHADEAGYLCHEFGDSALIL